jgi:hypothetical protein
MNESAIGRTQTDAVNDGCNDFGRIGEENIFADEDSDAALEAAASGPTVTFTLQRGGPMKP